MAIDPSLLGTPQDVTQTVPFDQFNEAYTQAINAAEAQLKATQGRYEQAQKVVQSIDANKVTNQEALKNAQDEMAKAAAIVEQANKVVTDAYSNRAKAIETYSRRANVPDELKQRYQAMADLDKATVQQKQAENFEYLNAIPEKRAQLTASTKEAQANAQVAQAKADLASATTDIEKQAAQTKLNQANASLQSTQLANTQAGFQNNITAAQAGVAPEVAKAGAAKATAEATTATAQAGIAPDMAQASLQKAQSDADKARLEVQALKRQFDSTTDEQAKQAVGLELQQKQTALDAAQQQLESARQLLPLSVRQAGANVAATEAGTQSGLLGNLYGLQDRVKAIADGLRSGQITDPEQARQQLNSYLQTAIAGTTPFEAQKTALDSETTRRQQDYTLAGNQMSALSSFGGSALGNMLTANRDAPAGSTAMAQSYGGLMSAMMGAFQGMQPNVPMDSPLLKSMGGLGGVGAPAASAAPMHTTTVGPDGSVTVGPASAASNPATMATGIMGPSLGGASPAPLPAMLSGTQMATPDHVTAMWQDDPNLNPGNSVATRTAYGDLNRGM